MDNPSFTAFEAPEGLLQRILMRLRHEEKRLRTAKRNLLIFSPAGLVSLAALIPAYQALSADIASSGLPHFLSLAASDPAIIAALWREFLFSLLESLPVISIDAALAVLLASLASLRMIATSFERVTDRQLVNN